METRDYVLNLYRDANAAGVALVYHFSNGASGTYWIIRATGKVYFLPFDAFHCSAMPDFRRGVLADGTALTMQVSELARWLGLDGEATLAQGGVA
jgi:hypothetical protein